MMKLEAVGRLHYQKHKPKGGRQVGRLALEEDRKDSGNEKVTQG